MRGAFGVFVWRPHDKRPLLDNLGEDIENNIKTHIQEVGWEGMNWTDLIQERFSWRATVNAVMNHRVP
jgi:hypothetical protein